ncbi:Tim17/Tim22/Tim23/Pmp24 family-domain-containing protein [Limtongia smithiae]|uniref:Tim17/Tim22/Tim23/Pmp24 family-domain-containing protein n=1 Tax=Limtongia smithiae TaxID=1125753 RepID=UPI0034CD3D40
MNILSIQRTNPATESQDFSTKKITANRRRRPSQPPQALPCAHPTVLAAPVRRRCRSLHVPDTTRKLQDTSLSTMVWPFGSTRSGDATATSPTAPTAFQPDAAAPSTAGGFATAFPSSTGSSSTDVAGIADVPAFLKQDFDVSQLHPLAGLGNDLEVLDLEDDALSSMPGSKGLLPSRGWSDDLCYGAGTVYMGGLALGGLYGFAEGMRTTPANAPAKLRINAVLNAITRRGPYLGNSAGVLAVTYNMINGALDAIRSYHDAYNSIAAGTVTGLLYRCTQGLTPALKSGLLMGTATGVWSFVTNAL